MGHTRFYLCFLRADLNEIAHEGGPLDPNALSPCDRDLTPLTRAPREGL